MSASKFLRSLFTTTNTRKHSTRLGFDSLEQRDNPAGTVMGTFAPRTGTWTLIGDAEANVITINPTGTLGEFVVTGIDTNVSGVTAPTGVNHIVVKMLNSADSVNFNTTDTPSMLNGNLTINGGNGANFVYIQDMTINGNISITNNQNASANGDVNDQFYLEDSSVKGLLTINNGEGSSITGIYRTSAGYSYLGKGLSVTNGTGNDAMFVKDYNLGGPVTVRNNLPAANNEAGYTQFYNEFNTTSRALIRGNVNISYSGGTHTGGERDGFWDCEVTGNVSYNYGGGTGDVRFDGYSVAQEVVITGNLSITGGGQTKVYVGNQGYQNTGMRIGGTLTITTGSGEDVISLYRLSVTYKTTINTNAGIDTVWIDDSRFKMFHLNTGLGNDVVNIETADGTANQTQFFGRTNIHLGNGDDTLNLGVAGDPTKQVEVGNINSFFGGNGEDTINANNVFALFGDPITVLA